LCAETVGGADIGVAAESFLLDRMPAAAPVIATAPRAAMAVTVLIRLEFDIFLPLG